MPETTLLTFGWGALAAVLLMLATILIHYEGLSLISGRMKPLSRCGRRWQLLVVMLGICVLHGLEILLYAGALAALEAWQLGALVFVENLPGSTHGTHYIYYAAVIYTSLGFGDIMPTGALRIVSGLGGLNGLLLIAWSASFTYMMMNRLWEK